VVGTTFQRARTPAQRAQRMNEVLAATRGLLVDTDVAALSLGAIAREARLASSNVLRYFGSREGLLLDLMDAEYSAWLPELDTSLSEQSPSLDIDRVSVVVADTLTARPILSRLIAASPELLRYPMPETAVARCRAQGRRHRDELARILSRALDIDLTPTRQAYLVAGLHAVISAASAWTAQTAFPIDFTTATRELAAIQLHGLVTTAQR
jgi:AcrR family transcriptional regulator